MRPPFADDEDWHSVNVLGEGVLTLNPIATGEQNSEGMEISPLTGRAKTVGAVREFIKSLRWWGNHSTTIALGEAGTYYFKVRLHDSPNSFRTRLTTNLHLSLKLKLSGVETEPNGDNENADAMNFGEEITGELADASDVDWYKISVAGAGTLTLDRVMSGKRENWNGEFIYIEGEFDWSNPEWMMGHRNWSSGSKTYALGEAGIYYFEISSYAETYSNSVYKLTPSFELGLSGVETEPNGDHENADVMNFGERDIR